MQDRRERELVLAPNEFAYVLDTTKGQINCYVGPNKTSLAQTDQPVLFNARTKRFEDVELGQAVQLFATAPASWYMVLKNPAQNNHHPKPGVASTLIELEVGRKINVPGPASFPLWPGQLVRVIEGHRLRANEYLVARVYDAEQANRHVPAALGRPGEPAPERRFSTGEALVIRGTDCRFYVPPTGLEVVPDERGRHVREAVSLGRLEYCVLVGEDGRKRVIRGEAVVFPEADQRFLERGERRCFPAIELSDTTGLHVKVTAPYTDEDGTAHREGEELFITGAGLIYFPREEHQLMRAGEQEVHEALAIPRGDGRYVLDRGTGEVELVRGPRMFLADPRVQCLQPRTLTERESRLLFPHDPPAPRGRVLREAVRVDVPAGFAVQVVDKGGQRRVERGPASILLAYDEMLQSLSLSTGRPKRDVELLETVFLQVTGNKVTDQVEVLTQDLVRARLLLTYRVSFEGRDPDRWFAVDNYIKLLCDHASSMIKARLRQLPIRALQAEITQTVRDVLLGEKPEAGARPGRAFEENGMRVYDVEVLELDIVDEDLRELLVSAQTESIERAIELTAREVGLERQRRAEQIERALLRERHDTALLEQALAEERAERARALAEAERAARARLAELDAAAQRAQAELEGWLHSRALERREAEATQDLERARQAQALELEALSARVEGAVRAAQAFEPQLVEALRRLGDQQLLGALSQNFGELAAVEGRGLLETARRYLDFVPAALVPRLHTDPLKPPGA